MRTKILILSVITILMAGCKKGQFTTKPQLKFDSFNTNVVTSPGQLIMTLNYTDKEGDIQDTIYVERRSVNCSTDTLRAFYAIPSNVPEKTNAEGKIVISYSYAPDQQFPDIGDPKCGLNDPPGTKTNDTCIYRFALSDKAGNVSDTVSSPPVVIVKR
ncbi:MAG: hypothetical protein ABI861_02600 [Panacibacter sp.]